MALRTLEFWQRPDADGVLRLQVPVAASDQRYRVIVLIEPEPVTGAEEKWPSGVFESIAAGWEDECTETDSSS